MTGSEPSGSQYEFLYQDSFPGDPIILYRLQKKLYGFPNVAEGFFLGVSFAYAAGQRRYVNRVPAFLARLQGYS